MDTPKPTTFPPNASTAKEVEALRKEIFKNKARHRGHLAALPIEEKLRILEEMRDFTSALRPAREENKALVKEAWAKVGSHGEGAVHASGG